MNSGFFVTGTDTGVGKTVVAGALIRALKMLRVNTAGMKPVETGLDSPAHGDGMFLKDMAEMQENIGAVTPCSLAEPLAPMVAARIEGVNIDIGKIMEVFGDFTEKYDAVVVEGVGGLLVPIREDCTVLDLARMMKLPLVVVARPTLGTINHTLLTVKQAIYEGITVAGVILNHTRPPEGTRAEETNPIVLGELLPVPLIGVFPLLEEINRAALDKAVVKSLRMDVIKEYVSGASEDEGVKEEDE